jgi:hypothetical protein
LRAADHIEGMLEAPTRRRKTSSLHSLKDRAYYDRRRAHIPARRLIAETERLIAASRDLIAQVRPPELWPLYEDGPIQTSGES